MQVFDVLVGVDQDVAARLEALEDVHDAEQGRVLHDDRVRLANGFAKPDLLVVDAAERNDRRAHAFRAETRKRLRVLAFKKGGDGQQFGRGYDALAAAPVNANLEHHFPRRLSDFLDAGRRTTHTLLARMAEDRAAQNLGRRRDVTLSILMLLMD